MTDTKISSLPDATTLDGTEIAPIVQAGTTVKVALSDIAALASAPVSSVFGRTGAVVAASNDYTFAQIGSTPTTLAGYGITDAMSNPMTVAGDLIVGGSSGTPTRLGVGTDGYVLKMVSGTPTWVSSEAGVAWGAITGTLSDQTDLATALNDKLAIADNLSDLANAATARTNLGLGTAATTDITDYATAAQGTKADSAVQSVVAGSGVSVDNTDPQNPVVSATGSGSGTVTSVGLTQSGTGATLFDITGSPVTTAGSIDLALNTQTPNFIFSGPDGGGAATPDFRPMSVNDLPNSGITADTYGDSAHTLQVTITGKGTVTSCTPLAVAPPWGAMTGTLADQADLQTALDAKAALASANVFTAQQAVTPYRANISGTVSIDLAATAKSNNLHLTLTGNVTSFALTNPVDGAVYNIRFIQDSTGSRTITLPSAFKFAGGTAPTFSTAANAVDFMSAEYGSTESTYMAAFQKGMA